MLATVSLGVTYLPAWVAWMLLAVQVNGGTGLGRVGSEFTVCIYRPYK